MRRPKGRLDEQRLRDAVSHFLSPSYATHTRSFVRREILNSIRAVIQRILDSGLDAYLVGGTIRDLILGPQVVGSADPRDIDIVVVDVDHRKLKSIFRDIHVRDTRFNGLHLIDQRTQGLQVLYDVWALKETWAFRVRPDLPVRISSFPQLPFLNLDTAAVEIKSHHSRHRKVFENGFIDGVNHQTVELNFAPNPYPDLCVVRAILTAAKLQFGIGPKLLQFIVDHVRKTDIDKLMSIQQSHYGTLRCTAKQLSFWIDTLRAASIGGESPRLLITPDQQLKLWHNYPPTSSPLVKEESNLLVIPR
jgi:hypothetical protein